MAIPHIYWEHICEFLRSISCTFSLSHEDRHASIYMVKQTLSDNIAVGRKFFFLRDNLRGLKVSYSCSIVSVGSPSSGPIFWDAEISAVKGHVSNSPTAATLTHQMSFTRKKNLTTNCSLATMISTIGSSRSYTMCYFNLQWSEQWLLQIVVQSNLQDRYLKGKTKTISEIS